MQNGFGGGGVAVSWMLDESRCCNPDGVVNVSAEEKSSKCSSAGVIPIIICYNELLWTITEERVAWPYVRALQSSSY